GFVGSLTLGAEPSILGEPSPNPVGSVTFTGPIDLPSDKNLKVQASGEVRFVGPDADITARGNASINVTTTRNIVVEAGASLTSAGGDIGLTANFAATSNPG